MPSISTATVIDIKPKSGVTHNIPEPTNDPDSLLITARALKEAVEIMSRQRGHINDSAVIVRDLELLFGQLDSLYGVGSPTSGVTNGLNLGTGFQIFSLVVGNVMEFRTLTSNNGTIDFIQSSTELDLAIGEIDGGTF